MANVAVSYIFTDGPGNVASGVQVSKNFQDLIDAIKEAVPAGLIAPTGRAAAPTGWLMCNGQAVSRATYAELFNAIGTTYGAGDGSSTFNVPDLRGRVPVGEDGSAGRLSASDARGNSGGEEKHTLTTAELAAHDHPMVSSNAGGAATSINGSGDALASHGGPAVNGPMLLRGGDSGFYAALGIGANGGGGAHNNMQPYQVVNFMIRV